MDQQFSLSWNNFHGNLSKGFAGLLGNGEFVDVTIAVEGHLLQAHKVILSICSPYFKKMFQMNPCQHPIIVIRDVSHKSMRDLLQFMYHGEVSVKREDLTNFIGTAEVLQIKGLTNQGFNQEAEDDNESEQELPKGSIENQNVTPEPELCAEPYNTSLNDTAQKNDLDLLKQKQFIEKLQRISNLKRKSEDYNSYFTDLMNDKRGKLNDRLISQSKRNQKSNYEHPKPIYDENPLDITSTYNPHLQRANSVHDSNDSKDSPPEENVEMKTECDDSDIIITDPLAVTPTKSYDGRDGKKDLPLPMDYPSPQDSTACLSSLFIDLKNLVNGKVTTARNDDYPRHPVDCLVTIPQKEDGKKKYPQRSCRLCWKIGRRRDTRFMCSACEQPFCKSPCFGIHYNDLHKVPLNYAT